MKSLQGIEMFARTRLSEWEWAGFVVYKMCSLLWERRKDSETMRRGRVEGIGITLIRIMHEKGFI